MSKEQYISPSAEVVGLDATGVLASSPYRMEGMESSGNYIEWDWAN